jgi:hypothetical protein
MPRPYHTPKSERDENLGKILDLEARRPVYRFNAVFTDRKGGTTEWDFSDHTTGEACEAVNAEADLHNTRGALPDIGKVYKVELYDYNAQEWFRWYY